MIKKDKSILSKIKFEVDKLNYGGLKAKEYDKDAQSGREVYNDFPKMNFVINGKPIDKNLVEMLYEEVNCNKKENDIMNDDKIEETVGYNNHDLSNNNQEHLLAFLEQSFIEMFKHAGAKVPNDSILRELAVNCCRYNHFFSLEVLLHGNIFTAGPQKNTIYINCNDNNNVELKVNREGNVRSNEMNMNDNDILMFSSLEFKLKSNNNEVEYIDGKLSLTFTPKSIEQDKNLFSKLVKAVRTLLQKAFGKKNVKEVKHEFEFYEPNSIINDPEVKGMDDRSQNIIK